MKQTKIIATMGPAIKTMSDLEMLIKKGMNVMRINFSHVDYEDVSKRIAYLNEVNNSLDTFIPWLCDTKGPEVRTGKINNNEMSVIKDQLLDIVDYDVVGDSNVICTTYKDMYKYVQKGDLILIDDGLVSLKVITVENSIIKTKVCNSGVIATKKGVNVPGVDLKMDYLSEQDIFDITWGCNNNASYIAASFTRTAQDILDVKAICEKNNRSDMKIIAKIENKMGIDNIDEILKVSDGIMVARGDLGTEIPMEDVPLAQIELCKKANLAGKIVIVATHMLESMQSNIRPTRAEVGDVARAVLDGVDAVMLSGETAKGEYPFEAVEAMAKIVEKSETMIDHDAIIEKFLADISKNPYDGIGISGVELASKINAKAIFCFTRSGNTAMKISKYRPVCPIYALSDNDLALYSLALNWGVYPIKKGLYTTLNDKYEIVNEKCRELGFNIGDYVLITGGHPDGTKLTNFLKIMEVY